MLETMPSKKITKQKKNEIESNLILFGLLLVLILSTITLWHVTYKKNQINSAEASATNQELAQKADINQDGNIDEKDAKLIKEAFLKSDIESLKADLNQDNKVDAKDFSLFNKIFNLKEKEQNDSK